MQATGEEVIAAVRNDEAVTFDVREPFDLAGKANGGHAHFPVLDKYATIARHRLGTVTMNEKLELFRRRLRGAPKERLNWRALWIGSPTAWLALLISCTTAFFNMIYYSEELTVVFDVSSGTDRTGHVSLSAPIQFMLVNSGSRPVGILRATLDAYFAGPAEEKLDDCFQLDPFSSVDVGIEPRVLKAGEITALKARPVPAADTFQVAKPAEKAELRSFFCLNIDYVTTSSVVVEFNRIPIPTVWTVLLPGKSFMSLGAVRRQYLVRRNTFSRLPFLTAKPLR